MCYILWGILARDSTLLIKMKMNVFQGRPSNPTKKIFQWKCEAEAAKSQAVTAAKLYTSKKILASELQWEEKGLLSTGYLVPERESN